MKPAKPYCDKMSQHFNDYHDGELSAFLRGVVRKHLQSCSPCRRDYTLLQMTIEAVKQKRAPDVSPKLLKKVIAACSNTPRGGTPISEDLRGINWLDGLQNS